MDSKCSKGSFLYTGCDEVDRQHKGFFKLLEKMKLQVDDNDSSQLDDIISQLYLYSLYHFETEERIFSQYPFLDFSKHLKQHQAFSERIEHFKTVSLLDDTKTTHNLIKFMENWLISHIQKIDIASFKAIEDLKNTK